MKKIHLIMPMGGRGSRFAQYANNYPKPLLEIGGKPFFFWAAQSISRYIDLQDIIFVTLEEHVREYEIDKRIKEEYPGAIIKVIPEVLNGAVLTCLEGIKDISDDFPVLFNDCDHIFRCEAFEKWCRQGMQEGKTDGALLTFPSQEAKYSYVKLDNAENVTATAEKQVISNQAICGCYYFGDAELFRTTADIYLKQCQYQEYFISGMYNIMIMENKVIKAFQTDYHVPFGTPEEYELAQRIDMYEHIFLAGSNIDD